jgi:hypothetical protein
LFIFKFGTDKIPLSRFQTKPNHSKLLKFWRSKGFLIVVYQDDGLGFADSEESCNYMSGKALTDLLSAGFLPNYEKSVWTHNPCN